MSLFDTKQKWQIEITIVIIRERNNREIIRENQSLQRGQTINLKDEQNYICLSFKLIIYKPWRPKVFF